MKRAARLIGLLITTIANAGLAQSRVGSINVGDALINYESTGRGQAIVFIHG